MGTEDTGNGPTFKDLELAGWQSKAENYHRYGGRITKEATGALLDAAGVGEGTRLLDVATGPGYGAGAAAARGARAIGIDFASSMVALAGKTFPAAEYREGDAEALPFAEGTYDAVICPFGLLHLADPDRAVAEAYRVLRPGGRYAFTVWCAPEEGNFFGIVNGAIRKHGTTDLDLPPAPPFFRFADHDECRGVLGNAGFVEANVAVVPLYWRGTAQSMLETLYKSTVRTLMVLERQTEEARGRIDRAILEGAQRFATNGDVAIPGPAVLASARKP